jgi:hypothetical protein
MKLQSTVRQSDNSVAFVTWKLKGLRRPKIAVKADGRAVHREELIMNNEIESTYTLLVRSEDRSRNMIEVGGFSLIALSALVAVWQFAVQPTSLPLDRVKAADQQSLIGVAS